MATVMDVNNERSGGGRRQKYQVSSVLNSNLTPILTIEAFKLVLEVTSFGVRDADAQPELQYCGGDVQTNNQIVEMERDLY